MSQRKSTEISGDVSVGRNVNIGGSAIVRVNALVKKNLRVEGWLDARNVKAANKGVFSTLDSLRESYPRPHYGWFAGIPATEAEISGLGLSAERGKAYLRLYIGVDGEWVREPTGKLYEIVIDMERLDDLEEDLSGLRGEHDELKQEVADQETEIAEMRIDIDSVAELADAANKTANEANARSKYNSQALSSINTEFRAGLDKLRQAHEADIKKMEDAVGAPSGIAPLDASAKVPAAYLPGYVDDVVEFGEWLSPQGGGVIETFPIGTYTEKSSADAGCVVVYHEYGRQLLLRETLEDECRYYADWADGEAYGMLADGERKPVSGKVYTCSTTSQTYRWSGEHLVVIGTDLALGRTSSTAFPGDGGRLLEEKVEDLESAQELTEAMLFVNANQANGYDGPYLHVLGAVAELPEACRRQGVVVTFKYAAFAAGPFPIYKWTSFQWIGGDWDDEECWIPYVGGGVTALSTDEILELIK